MKDKKIIENPSTAQITGNNFLGNTTTSLILPIFSVKYPPGRIGKGRVSKMLLEACVTMTWTSMWTTT